MMDDLRFAVRLWRHSPAFAFAVVLTLALGIALNTSLFGIVNAVWFRPLTFPQGDRLVFLNEFHARKGFSQPVSAPALADWRRLARSFEAMGALGEQEVTLSGDGEPERLRGAFISASLPAILGFQPVLGRSFTSDDEGPGAPRVALISQRFWEQRFAAARDVIGREIRLDGMPATIVGVLPYGFRLQFSGYQVLQPLRPATARDARFLQVVARLGPGVTLEQARVEMSAVARRLATEFPATNAGWDARAAPLKEIMWADARPLYLALMAASGVLLLLICANIANLLLARAAGRRKEIAVRMALGAKRWRVARQMLLEGAGLSLAGGALAFLICLWACNAVVAAYPDIKELAVDLRVFAFTLGISLFSGLAFSLAPALASSKPDLNSELKGSGPGGPQAHLRLGSTLTVAQLALASALIMAAGLLVRSILQMRSADPGFDTRRLLTAALTLPASESGNTSRQVEFFGTALDRLSAIPGVTSAAGATVLPLMGGDKRLRLEIEGRPAHPDGDYIATVFSAVSEGYFRTLGIAIERGRSFGPADRGEAPLSAIVNRAFVTALRIDPSRAIGSRVRIGDGPWRQIVGIAADVRQILVRPPLPQICVPLAQAPGPTLWVALRTAGSANLSLAPAVRTATRELDPHLSVSYLQSMEAVVEEYFPRPLALGLAVFSLIALALASMGMYGVASFRVARRTREFGVRMALGAGRAALWRLVLGEGLKLTAAGLVLGLAAGWALGRGLARYLYGVNPADAAVFSVVCVVLGAVTLAACAAPARRATRADPASVLRWD